MSDTVISPAQAGDYAIEQLLHKGHEVRVLVHCIDDRSQRPPLWLEAFIELQISTRPRRRSPLD